MGWKIKLKKICSQIPTNIPVYIINSYVSKFLKLRKQSVLCRYCSVPFYAHSSAQLLYPTCKKCTLKRKREKEKTELQQQIRENEKNNRIEKWKIKNCKHSSGTPPSDYYTMLRYLTDREIEKLKKLKYADFLNSIYWKSIKRYVLYKRNYKCELCFTNKNLQVHHKTYISHGYEHENLEHLIVLCEHCHKQHHNK